MKRKIFSIKGFDNTQREYIGYVNIPIEVGGKIVDQKVYIFQINFPYNIFLGRPWIHKLKVVAYSLHYSIKFMHNGK